MVYVFEDSDIEVNQLTSSIYKIKNTTTSSQVLSLLMKLLIIQTYH